VLPTWPIEWLGNLGSHQNMLPLRTVPGLLLLLAAPRWRDPDARLLLGLACLPQRFPDLLPLWLIFREPRLALIVSALSWFITLFWHPEQMEISSLSANLAVIVLYLPALMVILRRPKLGTPMTPAREDSGRDH
jgi:hypothetical protein